MDAGEDPQVTALTRRVRQRVDEVLTEFLGARLDATEEAAVRFAFATVRDFVLRGGKRIRPTLCYWGWRGAEAADSPEIIRAAAALEVFHAFCLIHDDIMDDSDLRRGRPTVHRALACEHARSGWRGESRHFGISTAILLGDMCMAWADELLYGSGLGPERLTAARHCYHCMRTEVFHGQYLDLLEEARGPSSVERSMTVVRYKTAKYTVERPLLIGGLLAGGSSALLRAYSAFGLALGEAYQLRDDLLGAFGDPAVTGKPDLDDFRHGKPTALVAHALRHGRPTQRRVIEALYGDPTLDGPGARRLREALHDTGAPRAVEAMIGERRERALTVLAAAPVGPPARQALTDLVAAAVDRAA
ncbi:polyprenyl synthetase family protein [Thermomonospora umbrina]|uniref:Geranylgeranyl diphosphate synthase type I n=1 Tax=Thermomonospora umbrina TaxID=111806 RepID=A0A3D9SLF6_9ACTN|nr:polyprenyl synthetase family protein [Thermomonospora umbrina]REE95230.1 geranylgeranyl diphosphate synthase type I [Thermomonospora umbrina]